MIMAGRGQRLMNVRNESQKIGVPKTSSENEEVDLASVINKIYEINTNDINPSILLNLQNQFKQLFTSKEAMIGTLSDLHTKALQDADFGEKLIIALEQVLNVEIDGTLLRGELLNFIQDDFKLRETMCKSDPKKFVNSVLLLGNVFHRIRVAGAPIKILSTALLQCFDLLIKGDEEQLKTLTKQILINGGKISETNNCELLEQNLRNTLVTANLNCPSKCWVLLAIDFLSNGLKPLKGTLKEFYIANLGTEYTKLEALIEVSNDPTFCSPSSSSSKNSLDSPPPKSNFNTNKSNNFKKDLSKKFSDMSVKSDSGKKEKTQSPPGKTNKKDIWKTSGNNRVNSGHDDRFEKEENFYGVQRPRELKPESQKKRNNDAKTSKKKSESNDTDLNNTAQPETELEASGN